MAKEEVVAETKGMRFVIETRKRAVVSKGEVELWAEVRGLVKGVYGETKITSVDLKEKVALDARDFYDVLRKFESKILDAEIAVREELIKTSMRLETLINHGFPLSLYY